MVSIVGFDVSIEITFKLSVECLATLIGSKLGLFTNIDPRDCQLLFLAGEPVWPSFLLLRIRIATLGGGDEINALTGGVGHVSFEFDGMYRVGVEGCIGLSWSGG